LLPNPPCLPPTTLQVIAEEEASFSRTLVKGLERFKKFAAASTDGKISGSEVGTGQRCTPTRHTPCWSPCVGVPAAHSCCMLPACSLPYPLMLPM
jgi:hypothetical protein